MNPLDRLEAACERIVEGGIARLFGRAVQPAEVARKVEAAMADGALIGAGRPIVPNDFAVSLHPADAAAFAAFEAALCRQWEGWLTEIAGERGWTLLGPVAVRLRADDGLARRQIRVAAAVVGGDGDSRSSAAREDRARPGAEPETARTPLVLQVLSGPQRGQELLLRGRMTVGRGPENDIVLLADDVSRRHAQLEVGAGGGRATDLGSTNGTRLNGRRIERAPFKPGDELAFGSVVAKVVRGGRGRR